MGRPKGSRNKKLLNFPRGEFRKNWDMPHKDSKAYDRKNEKKENKEAIQETEVNDNLSNSLSEISCSFREMREYQILPEKTNGETTEEKRKVGRYHGSNFPNLGEKRYPVAVWINVKYKPFLEKGFTKEQILESCVSFLNTKKPKARKPPYGDLLKTNYFTFKKDEHGTYISTILSTDDCKNKNFWGVGNKSPSLKNR